MKRKIGDLVAVRSMTIDDLGKSQRVLASFGSEHVTIEADPTAEILPGQEIVVSVEPSKTLMIKAS